VALGPDSEETSARTAPSITGRCPGPPTGLHVLVIEDDPAIGRQLERGLVRAGYSVSRAADGSQALLAGRPT